LNGIKEAKELVKESSTILENQKLAIDGIKETNNNLNGVLNDMQNKNDKMKNAILFKLSSSDKILDSIKKEMGKFIPHPPLNNK